MDITDRARAAGIQPEYLDAWGHLRRVDDGILHKLLAALPEPSDVAAPLSADTASRAYEGDFDRVWLLTCQLYGLRSKRNWGIGNFSDLSSLIDLAAKWGCAGIGLNPVHALFDDIAANHSPYSPSSRLFLNTIYIDWEVVEDLPADWGAARRDELDRAEAAEFVDYDAVTRLKTGAARDAFASFERLASPERRASFERFRQESGRELRYFACFEALRKQYSGPWWEWPEKWRRPSDALVDELRSGEHADHIALAEYKQWIAHEQLTHCQERAKRNGMAIGLYLDVAVGVQSGGFDAWFEQEAIARSLSVGAPPDILNTAGQDWGLSGFFTQGLQSRSFEPLRAIVNRAMRYSGAIRLDHVLGLQRLYVIPQGASARDGAYIDMPFERMADVICDESRKHRCVVIGEDLGTVPDGFRQQMSERCIFSYTVMMFEQNHDGFIDPSHYRENTLLTFNTHDLPTFKGWCAAEDITTKQRINIDPGETLDQRLHSVGKLKQRSNTDPDRDLVFLDVISILSQSPSRILAISIDDLLGVVQQPNIPGTIDEHPNWRRKLPSSIDEIGETVDASALRATLAERCR